MLRLTLLRFFENYFRHRWLYLLPSFLLVGIAGYFLLTTAPKYLSTGTIFVQKESFLATLNAVSGTDPSWWVTPAQTSSNEIKEFLQTSAFIRAVISKTDLEPKMDDGYEVVEETIKEAREAVWVTTLGDNQIQIQAQHENPQVSFQLATAVIENYIQWQLNAQRTEGEAAHTFFSDQIKIYEQELVRSREEMKTFLLANPEPLRSDRITVEKLELDRLQNGIDQAEKRYTNALEKEENARLALAQIDSNTRQSFTIIDAPRLAEKPEVSLREIALSAGALLAGSLLLFGFVVVGGMLMDHTFRLPLDVQHGLQLPVLAIVPDTNLGKKKIRKSKKHDALEEPGEGIEAVLEEEPVAEADSETKKRGRKDRKNKNAVKPLIEAIDGDEIPLSSELTDTDSQTNGWTSEVIYEKENSGN